HGERTVGEGHDGRRGVDVAVPAEEVGAAVAAHGVDLDGLPAGDPADDVEVVHATVAEHAPGHGDVLGCRRFGVQGGRPYRGDPTELATVDRGLGGGDAGVEAALDAELDRHVGARAPADVLG